MKNSTAVFFAPFILISLVIFGIIYLIMPKQVIAKSFGGSVSIQVQPNNKVINVTWKNNNMWILTRPMKEKEEVETYTFKEFSTFGVLQGTVTIQEQKE